MFKITRHMADTHTDRQAGRRSGGQVGKVSVNLQAVSKTAQMCCGSVYQERPNITSYIQASFGVSIADLESMDKC